jgi:VRR-NUC domain
MTDMSEKELQQAVVALAHLRQWRVAHFRPAQTEGRWSTPVSADGAGFPDLVLGRKGQVVMAELKARRGRLSDAQLDWLAALSTPDLADRRLRVYVWRPEDWVNGTIERALL